MASSWGDSWGSAWSNSWGVIGSTTDPLAPYNGMSLRDIQYEALKLTTTPSDARTMEHAYWLSLFGGRGSTGDILYSGVIVGLGFQDMKAYYDAQTSTVWPDRNSSEKAYWLKILADNL